MGAVYDAKLHKVLLHDHENGGGTATEELFEITATPTSAGAITGTFNKTAAEMRTAIAAGKKLLVKLTSDTTVYEYYCFYITDTTDALIIGFMRSVSGTSAPADEVMEWYSSGGGYNLHARESASVSGTVQVAATMPMASSTIVGNVYLYTGTTGDTYKHGHLYKCTESSGSYVFEDCQTGLYPVGNYTNIRCITQNTTVRLKWEDPADTLVAKWGKTVVVRKAGSAPADPADGTQIVTSTTRNQYSSSPYTDTIPDSSTTYYYKFFAYTEDGVCTNNDANTTHTGDLTWAGIADVVRSGDAEEFFSVGDTLTVQHSTYGTITMEIVGFDQHTPADSTKTHSMTMLAENCIGTGQFDASETEYGLTLDTVFHNDFVLAVNIKGAATATEFALWDESKTGNDREWYSRNGQYKLYYHSSRWEIWACNSGTHVPSSLQDYQTAVTTEPTGGTWNAATVCAENKVYYTYDGATYTAATVTKGAAVAANTYYEKNPAYSGQRQYGYNNWKQSGIRDWLNSSGNAGAWWSKKNPFDVAPGMANSAGFLAGFTDAEFLAAIGAVKLTTARNTICDCGGSDVTEDKVFLASNMEVFGSANNGVNEGVLMTKFVGAGNADRIKYNGSNPSNWWLRSPHCGYANYAYLTYSTSSLNFSGAYNTYGVAPACVIC